jgi:ATP-dependent exoDNAse (exonuclease V) beta subunit
MVDKKKPQYKNMTVDEIQYQWKEKAALSSMEGTELHALLERWPDKGCWGWLPKTYRLLKMGKQVDKLFPKLLERFKLVESEKLVFSKKLGIAGQIDLLMFDSSTDDVIVLDLKTNSKELSDNDNSFGNMLEPIKHLKDCDITKYSLQLELYCKLLKEENYYPEAKGYRKALLHIRPGISKVIKVIDYPDEVEKLLAFSIFLNINKTC